MKKLTAFWLCMCLFYVASAQQNSLLSNRLKKITSQVDGHTGISVVDLSSGEAININNNYRYVLHSVAKLPIALAVLQQVDRGALKLDQKIWITKADLPPTYSPLRDKYPQGDVSIRLDTLLSYMVSLSDNNACDILTHKLGGTAAVQRYLRGAGLKNITIKATEAQMAAAWPVQYTNWCHPAALTTLLKMLHGGKLLLPASTKFLYKIMLQTSTGPHRLKGMLPAGVQVAHKTGTSPVNKQGLAPATNDAGIIFLPDGRQIAIAVLVSNSTATGQKREAVIALAAKAVWDAYTKK